MMRLPIAALAGVIGLSLLVSMQRGPISGQTPPGASADVAQGQYLIRDIAHCEGCHGADLTGIASSADNPNFLPRPKIAGLPMFANDADAVKFFETGLLPDGVSRARRPMPQFRFKHGDAVAVVAYLRSLK